MTTTNTTTAVNALRPSVIRPGLLVSLSTRVSGGVRYEKNDLEREHAVGERATIAKWETTRHILDAQEYEQAQKVRSKVRTLICSVCCQSSFGLLCPNGKEADLLEALAAAQKLANDHNAVSRFTRVDVYVISGRISDSDVEAVRAISAEVRDLMADMERGIKEADPKAIRDAANSARMVAGMLSEDVQAKVGKAIEQVRSVATALVKAAKAGETAASVTQDLKLDKLEAARFAVLDIAGGTQDVREVAAPAAPAIDLLPEDDEEAPEAFPPGVEDALPDLPAPVARAIEL